LFSQEQIELAAHRTLVTNLRSVDSSDLHDVLCPFVA
jgi:hypothetical protein